MTTNSPPVAAKKPPRPRPAATAPRPATAPPRAPRPAAKGRVAAPPVSTALAARAISFVETVARMHWDGEECEDGTVADISNDDNHDTVISLISTSREILRDSGA